MCRSMVDIQSPTAEIRRGKKEEERRKKQDKNIYGLPIHRATINQFTMMKIISGFLISARLLIGLNAGVF